MAVEIDPRLAELLPRTVAERRPDLADRLDVVTADALRLTELPGPPPTALVANLPYNVAVPVLLHLLDLLPTLDRALILVQAEVAERLAALARGQGVRRPLGQGRLVRRGPPGGERRAAGVLARAQRRLRAGEPGPAAAAAGGPARPPSPSSTPPSACGARACAPPWPGWAGSPAAAEVRLRAAGIDPATRGEQLSVTDFARLAATDPVAAVTAEHRRTP